MKRNQGLTLDRQNRCKNFMETTTVSVDTDFAGYPAGYQPFNTTIKNTFMKKMPLNTLQSPV